MRAIIKVILLVIAAYIITVGMIIFASFGIVLLINPHDCSGYSRALGGLWGLLVVMFLAGVAGVGIGAWKVFPGGIGRLGTVTAYGVIMLASYVAIAFGLVVVFNC